MKPMLFGPRFSIPGSGQAPGSWNVRVTVTRREQTTWGWTGRPAWALLLLLVGLLAPPVRGAEQDELAPEYVRKAAYLYFFMDYTKWPAEAFADPKGPFVLGILGNDPWKGKLGKSYQEAGRKTMKGRPLVVTNCARAAEARTCHLVFISKSEKKRLPQILAELKETNVFSVVEADGPVETEAIISLYMKVEGKEQLLQFTLNKLALERAQLEMPPDVMNLSEPSGKK